eukprot:753644-Hanusia_phi.AAC.6
MAATPNFTVRAFSHLSVCADLSQSPAEEQSYNEEMQEIQESHDKVQAIYDLWQHEDIPIKFFGKERLWSPLYIRWLNSFLGGVDKWKQNNYEPPPDLVDPEVVLGCLDTTAIDMKDDIEEYKKRNNICEDFLGNAVNRGTMY